MKINKLVLIFSILLSSLMAGCSTTVDPSEAYRNENSEQIFSKGEDALRDKNYQEAIKRFEALDVQYPFGHNTEVAQLQIIYAYYMSSDYASAEAAADRFIHAHPTSMHADYAYYMRGLSNYYQNLGLFERFFAINLATRDLTQIKKSFADFSELVTIFPESPYAPAARQYMIYLRNILADYELNIARYYYCREAYVAAANRANIVVRHYQETPAVPVALVYMVKSYRHLQLTQDMNDALQVLRYNYPSSMYLQEAMH